jgi:plasmid stability protein
MPNILVRDLDSSLIAQLKVLAQNANRSLQAEAKIALSDYAARRAAQLKARERAKEIKASIGNRLQTDSAVLLREDRSR